MQLLFATLLFAFTASAASIPGLPTCADDCIGGDGTSYGGCKALDVKCICSNSTFLAKLACCVSKKCDAADQETTIQFADALCEGQGVTNLPTSATCASTTSSTGSSSTGSSAAAAGTTSSASSTASGASAAATSTDSVMSTSTSGTSASSTSLTPKQSKHSVHSSLSKAASVAASSASAASASATSKANSGAGGSNGRNEKLGVGMLIAGVIAAL